MLAVRAAPLLVVPVAAQLVSGEGPLVWGSGLQLEHFGRGTVCKIPKPFWGGSCTCTCTTIFMYTRARAVAVALPPALAALCSSYIPSEAAQFFSLSAFGLCLTSLVLICIYMYEIDHACTCTCTRS